MTAYSRTRTCTKCKFKDTQMVNMHGDFDGWDDASLVMAPAHCPYCRHTKKISRLPRAERPRSNMPIEKLIAQYEEECCDHSDKQWLRAAALRYVETMEDSQVRCLLYALANTIEVVDPVS